MATPMFFPQYFPLQQQQQQFYGFPSASPAMSSSMMFEASPSFGCNSYPTASDMLIASTSQFPTTNFQSTTAVINNVNNLGYAPSCQDIDGAFDLSILDDINSLLVGDSSPSSPSQETALLNAFDSPLFDGLFNLPGDVDCSTTDSYPNSPESLSSPPSEPFGAPNNNNIPRATKNTIRRRTSKPRVVRQLSNDDVQNRKDTHNNSERLRRKDLKNSFDSLRCNIPEISSLTRVHTGAILKHAIDHIKQLEREEERNMRELAELRLRNAQLRAVYGLY